MRASRGNCARCGNPADVELDLPRILEVLDRHAVRYVLIGGLAAVVHGSPFPTEDADITPQTDGASCEGADGYSDVGQDTPVIVKNGKGEILATTSLGQGKGSNADCTFSFSFPVTEGQDRYVVSVGRRGEFSYTFEQLRAGGIEIHLGH